VLSFGAVCQWIDWIVALEFGLAGMTKFQYFRSIPFGPLMHSTSDIRYIADICINGPGFERPNHASSDSGLNFSWITPNSVSSPSTLYLC